jgi:hypothetical protein
VTLPNSGAARWTAGRKRAVLLALDLDEIGEEEVCRRYAIHPDELAAWRRGAVYVLPANRRSSGDSLISARVRGCQPASRPAEIDLDDAERAAVARLIREHLLTTRNALAPSLESLKSAYAKLTPGDQPPPTPRLKRQPLGVRGRGP